jgi:uncharacterized RDD family membrane protein YckC
MVFWIIRDGKKEGPLEDYEVREMIRDGELGGETRVWHEGADEWTPAAKDGLLAGEFVQEKEDPEIEVEVIQREPFRAWRRFGARFFDFFLYTLILTAASRLSKVPLLPDPGEVPSVWFMIGTVLPAILIEAALLGSVGFTPGKWLLRMRVENLDGRRLTTGQAFVRSLRVWILGMGMREPILMLLGHILSLWVGLKKGVLLWDWQSGFEVRSKPLDGKCLTRYAVAFLAMIVISFWLVWPELGPIYDEMAVPVK